MLFRRRMPVCLYACMPVCLYACMPVCLFRRQLPDLKAAFQPAVVDKIIDYPNLPEVEAIKKAA